MASSEQKLISCIGFARRMAKRLSLNAVGGHLDHALVILAQVEPRTMPASKQSNPIPLNEMIPKSPSVLSTEVSTTSERALMESDYLDLLAHGQERLQHIEALLETRVQQYWQQNEGILEKLQANTKELAERTEAITQLQQRLRHLEGTAPALQLVPEEASCRLDSPARRVSATSAPMVPFLNLRDVCNLRGVDRAQHVRSAAAVLDGRVYLMGGTSRGVEVGLCLGTAAWKDLLTGWITAMNYRCSAAVTGGHLYLVGGFHRGYALSSFECFDGKSWRSLAPSLVPRWCRGDGGRGELCSSGHTWNGLCLWRPQRRHATGQRGPIPAWLRLLGAREHPPNTSQAPVGGGQG
eukprot:Skav226228  [mRNA]  locus=scaffold1218:243597:253178:- [translate_table: standard]